MDMADEANDLMQAEIDAALARHRKPVTASAVECIECGERISEVRRKVIPGVQRCVDCQEYADMRWRHG